jgi:hypothetical protein
MRVSLTYIDTLVYYDNHQLVLLKDNLEVKYMGILVEEKELESVYFCAPISNTNYSTLINNKIDLRTVLLDVPYWCLINTDSIVSQQESVAISEDPIPEEYLPETGFLVSPPSTSEAILFLANERRNIVSELTLEPEEAVNHAINTKTLSLLLEAFQGLVRQAVRLTKDSAKKSNQVASYAHNLNVVAFAPGSFKILFESNRGLDLLGDTELEKAFNLINKVLASTNNDEQLAEAIVGYKGHFVASLIKFLRIAEENQTFLKLSWAKPDFKEANTVVVEERFVTPALEFLSEQKEMQIEKIVFTGYLDKVYVSEGKWGFIGEDKEEYYSGKVAEGGPSLMSLVTGQKYEVECTERIIESTNTNKEITELTAIKFKKI